MKTADDEPFNPYARTRRGFAVMRALGIGRRLSGAHSVSSTHNLLRAAVRNAAKLRRGIGEGWVVWLMVVEPGGKLRELDRRELEQ